MENLKKLIELLHKKGDVDALELLRKAVHDDLKGMSIVDDPNESFEEDEAGKWLKQQEAKAPAQPSSQTRRSYAREWQAPKVEDAETAQRIKKLMDEGFSEREAHRMAGVHKEPSDFYEAMKSGVHPSPMSEKMLSMLKPLAEEWVNRADMQEKLNADMEKNPMKHAAGHMIQEVEKHLGNYKKAYHDFLNSPEVKELKGAARLRAIRQWKKDWAEKNPEHIENLTQAAKAQKIYADAKDAARRRLHDRIAHIMSGGASMPGVSMTEAVQHLGQAIKEDETPAGAVGTAGGVSRSFAAQNKKLMEILKQEHMKDRLDRLKRVDSQAKAANVIRRRKGEEDK